MKGKNEKAPEKQEPQDEKATVDQIKRKYGFPLSGVSMQIQYICIQLYAPKALPMYDWKKWFALIKTELPPSMFCQSQVDYLYL